MMLFSDLGEVTHKRHSFVMTYLNLKLTASHQ